MEKECNKENTCQKVTEQEIRDFQNNYHIFNLKIQASEVKNDTVYLEVELMLKDTPFMKAYNPEKNRRFLEIPLSYREFERKYNEYTHINTVFPRNVLVVLKLDDKITQKISENLSSLFSAQKNYNLVLDKYYLFKKSFKDFYKYHKKRFPLYQVFNFQDKDQEKYFPSFIVDLENKLAFFYPELIKGWQSLLIPAYRYQNPTDKNDKVFKHLIPELEKEEKNSEKPRDILNMLSKQAGKIYDQYQNKFYQEIENLLIREKQEKIEKICEYEFTIEELETTTHPEMDFVLEHLEQKIENEDLISLGQIAYQEMLFNPETEFTIDHDDTIICYTDFNMENKEEVIRTILYGIG